MERKMNDAERQLEEYRRRLIDALRAQIEAELKVDDLRWTIRRLEEGNDALIEELKDKGAAGD